MLVYADPTITKVLSPLFLGAVLIYYGLTFDFIAVSGMIFCHM